MTQTLLSPDEMATRQLIEWCARIERRRQMANSQMDEAHAARNPRRPNPTRRSGSPTRVA